jgi:hypothetical protein
MWFGFLYFLPSYRCEVHKVIFQYHEQWCLLCNSMWMKWNKESLFWCIRHPILFLQLVNSTMEVFDTDKDGFLNISEFSTLMWTSGLDLRWWPTRHYGCLEWHERMKNTQEEASKQGLFPVHAALQHVYYTVLISSTIGVWLILGFCPNFEKPYNRGCVYTPLKGFQSLEWGNFCAWRF